MVLPKMGNDAINMEQKKYLLITLRGRGVNVSIYIELFEIGCYVLCDI